MQQGIFGHDHPRIVSTLDNLGFSYSKNKEYASALACYEKMIKAQIAHAGTITDTCFETYRKQILMCEKLKRFSEAVEETKKMIKLEKSMLPHNHKIITATKDLLKDLTKKLDRASAAPVAI